MKIKVTVARSERRKTSVSKLMRISRTATIESPARNSRSTLRQFLCGANCANASDRDMDDPLQTRRRCIKAKSRQKPHRNDQEAGEPGLNSAGLTEPSAGYRRLGGSLSSLGLASSSNAIGQ